MVLNSSHESLFRVVGEQACRVKGEELASRAIARMRALPRRASIVLALLPMPSHNCTEPELDKERQIGDPSTQAVEL